MFERSTRFPVSPDTGPAPEVWNVIEGRGLEVVGRLGWAAYREILERLSWVPIAETQLVQISELKKKALREPPYETDRIQAAKIRQAIRDFAATSGYRPDIHNKVYAGGNALPEPGREKTTRIYLALREGGAVYAFQTLKEQCAEKHILDKIMVVLNLETIDKPDPCDADNNTVIIYSLDSDPEILGRAAAAITSAKRKHPGFFELTSKQLADVKAESTAEFMVPLDDTTWFVEVEPSKKKGLESYHTAILADFRMSLYRAHPSLVGGMPNLNVYQETVRQYGNAHGDEPLIRSYFTGKLMPRRMMMPALVVNK